MLAATNSHLYFSLRAASAKSSSSKFAVFWLKPGRGVIDTRLKKKDSRFCFALWKVEAVTTGDSQERASAGSTVGCGDGCIHVSMCVDGRALDNGCMYGCDHQISS